MPGRRSRTSGAEKFGLLLWKNWLLQKRNVLQTIVEIVLPIFFCVVLVIIRDLAPSTAYDDPTVYPTYPLSELPVQPNQTPGVFRTFVKKVLGLSPSRKRRHIQWSEEDGGNIPPPIGVVPGGAPSRGGGGGGVHLRRQKRQFLMDFMSSSPAEFHWPVAFTPANDVTRDIMALAALRLDHLIEPVDFESEGELLGNLSTLIVPSDTSASYEYSPDDYLGGVVFSQEFAGLTANDDLPNDLSYKIRLKGSLRNGYKLMAFSPPPQWFTEMVYPPFQVPGPRDKNLSSGPRPGYYMEGFLTLQHAIDMALAEYISGTEPSVTVSMGRMPHPPYIDDKYLVALQAWLPLILLLSYLYPAVNIVKNIVHEKERKLKESMKMMGLPNYLHWMAWFVKSIMFLLVTTVLITILLCTQWKGSLSLAVLNNSDPSLVFFFLFVYIICTISFCFLISTLFSKANSAATAMGLLWIFSYLPNEFLRPRYGSLTLVHKLTLCLYFNTGMGLGCQLSSMFEGTGSGIQWSLLFKGVSPDDPFTIGHIMVMMAIDTVIYGLLTWYIEAVFPGEFGVPQPWYFPVSKSYWFGPDLDKKFNSQFSRPNSAFLQPDPDYFESDPQGLQIGIKIQGLTKEFKSSKKIAVNNMNLNMYNNQITVLLGHNGAGKTTTMSMLTGLFPPSSGTAYVNGYDIVREIEHVRNSIGICPQHDVLFDELTVSEHIQFFSRLKGLPNIDVKSEIKRIVAALKLEDKISAESRTLSGGMKRKLSVGIALCAGSQVVFMDEPTSGMDPGARRLIWDLLQKEKFGRTILLTTHFMEEADYLGDWIAIMALGVIQCCGSSMFLKKRYGAGYYLTIVKQEKCNVSSITERIKSFIPDARVDQNHGAELSYILPNEKVSVFEKLFDFLEKNKDDLKISSYGASQTTMDEVFLRVGEAAEHKEQMLQYRLQGGGVPLTNEPPLTPAANGTVTTGMPTDNILMSSMDSLDEESITASAAPTATPPPSTGSPHTSANVKTHRRTNSGTANSIRTQLKREIEEQVAKDIARRPEKGHLLQDLEAGNEAAAVSLTSLTTSDHTHRRTPITRNTGLLLLLQQFWAMLVKKMLYVFRNGVISVVQMLVPVGFLILALVIVRTIPGLVDKPPPLVANYDVFRGTVTPVVDASSSNTSQSIVDALNAVLSGRDVTRVLPATQDMTDYLLEQATIDLPSFNLRWLGAVEVLAGDHINLYFNGKPFHAPPATLRALDEAILRSHTGNNNLRLTIVNHPLPRADTDKLTQDNRQSMGFQIGFNLAFGTSFLSGSLVMFLIKERCSNAKHLQFVSGVNFVTYWLATAIVDFLMYLVPFALALACLKVFNEENLREPEQLGTIFFILMLFAWAMSPLMYLCSFLFTVPSSGFTRMSMINCFIGMATLITVTILRIPDLDLTHIADLLDWVFMVFPPYAMAAAITELHSNHRFTKICDNEAIKMGCSYGFLEIPCCKDTGNCGEYGCVSWQPNVFAWEKFGIGRMVTFLAVEGIVFYIFIALVELKVFQSLKYTIQKMEYKINTAILQSRTKKEAENAIREEELEEDVKAEAIRIKDTPLEKLLSSNILVFKELTKRYGSNNHLAVDHLNIGVPKGECFGLLGINGAGKTTTFKMLTGDHTVSFGDAYVNGYSISYDIKKVQQEVGYCPQFDAILDQMTGRETLRMFARLRGVPERLIDGHITSLAEQLIVTPHLDNLVGNYSGGNKRKISTGISLIGDPPLVLLDEPTSGMDPVARRHLWDVLTSARDAGTSIVLTSHSMEECEALCTRIAIMTNGRFRCLGSPQHLKSKFSEGYSLIVRVAMTGNQDTDHIDASDLPTEMATFDTFLKEHFPQCMLREVQWGRSEYFIPALGVSWGDVFGTMERNKDKVLDYSVTQTTLERVFLNFTRAQASDE